MGVDDARWHDNTSGCKLAPKNNALLHDIVTYVHLKGKKDHMVLRIKLCECEVKLPMKVIMLASYAW